MREGSVTLHGSQSASGSPVRDGGGDGGDRDGRGGRDGGRRLPSAPRGGSRFEGGVHSPCRAGPGPFHPRSALTVACLFPEQSAVSSRLPLPWPPRPVPWFLLERGVSGVFFRNQWYPPHGLGSSSRPVSSGPQHLGPALLAPGTFSP